MTDHDNADETDGQNSKLSRRTALGLMGVSAVGGAAASSAYSELTADRLIDVDVVDNGDAETADSGSSELQISNNTGSQINAEVSTDNTSIQANSPDVDTNYDDFNGPWTIEGISGNDTVTVEFLNTEPGTTPVDFDVSAFSGTDGFSIDTTPTVDVDSGVPDSTVFYPINETSGSTLNNVISDDYDISLENSPSFSSDKDSFAGSKLTLNGSDEYGTLDWPELGSQLNNFAIAFTIEDVSTTNFIISQLDSPRFEVFNQSSWGSDDTGPVKLYIEDDDDNDLTVEGSTDIDDENRYRVFIRVVDASNNDVEIYVTQEGESFGSDEASLVREENPSNFSDWDEEFDIGRRNNDDNYIDGAIDSLAIWENDPGANEPELDFNRQPWS